VDEATRRVSLTVETGVDRLRMALGRLETAGVEVEDAALRQPTLDEVFLAITGRSHAETDDTTTHPAEAAA
jgi:ABC-2 type transport system ATP-binding protein